MTGDPIADVIVSRGPEFDAGFTRVEVRRVSVSLALADLIGLDTLLAVSESLYEEFRDPASVAPAVLNRMVEAGLLGRKSGRGFYDYSKN